MQRRHVHHEPADLVGQAGFIDHVELREFASDHLRDSLERLAGRLVGLLRLDTAFLQIVHAGFRAGAIDIAPEIVPRPVHRNDHPLCIEHGDMYDQRMQNRSRELLLLLKQLLASA